MCRYYRRQVLTVLDSEHDLNINLKHWQTHALYQWLLEADKEDLTILQKFNKARTKYGMPKHLEEHFFELGSESPILLELVCYPVDEQRKAGVACIVCVLPD